MTILWLMSALALADEIPATSKVVAVTVYQDRARIIREATVEVPEGAHELVFDGLSYALMPASLAAEGEGNAKAVLTGIDVRPKRGTEERDARVKVLAAERRELERKIGAQRDVVARAQADVVFVTSVKPVAPKALDEELFLADDVAEQLGGLATLVGEQVNKRLTELRTAERAIRDFEAQVAKIDRETAELGGGAGPDVQRVAVGVDAKRAGSVTVRVSYLVTGAAWTPHYDARFGIADAKVKLDVAGTVVQTTGEDWRDVKLTLSTARPQEGTAPPALEPFWLNEGYGVVNTGSGGGSAATAFEFSAGRTEDVLSDGTKKRVYLTTLDLGGEVIHRVVSRRVEAAWLTVRAKNVAEFTLLPGTLSSYLGSAYVGDGNLGQVGPGDRLDLSFGVDDRVAVKRKRLVDQEGGPKALGNRERATYAFETEVTNRTGKAIQIEVTEQVPASRDAKWEIKTTTTPNATVPSTGVFQWSGPLENGAAQVYAVKYEVSWPQGDRPVLLD